MHFNQWYDSSTQIINLPVGTIKRKQTKNYQLEEEEEENARPWRLLSSHLDCLVLIWLAHHHE